MSGETEKRTSGWTTDTLHQHLQMQVDDLRRLLDERYGTQTKALDAAFSAAEKAVQSALVAAEKAVTKAEVSTEKRFEAVNEFRAALNDQTATFMPRAEVENMVGANATLIADLKERVGAMENRDVGSGATSNAHRLNTVAAVQVLGFIVLAAGLVFSVVHGG